MGCDSGLKADLVGAMCAMTRGEGLQCGAVPWPAPSLSSQESLLVYRWAVCVRVRVYMCVCVYPEMTAQSLLHCIAAEPRSRSRSPPPCFPNSQSKGLDWIKQARLAVNRVIASYQVVLGRGYCCSFFLLSSLSLFCNCRVFTTCIRSTPRPSELLGFEVAIFSSACIGWVRYR